MLNDMGYIRPRLIETNNAALIQGTDANAVASVKGQLERGGRPPNGDAVVMGWAVFLDKSRPADAVFLTCDDAHGQPIIFAFADEIGVRRDDIAQQLGDADLAPVWLGRNVSVFTLAQRHQTTDAAQPGHWIAKPEPRFFCKARSRCTQHLQRRATPDQ